MSNYLKIGGLLLVGTLVGLLIRSGAPEVDLAGVYSLSNQNFTQGLKVGTTDQFQVSNTGAVTIGTGGTAVQKVLQGTCNAATTGLPLAATSSIAMTCAVTGATSGDKAFVQIPRTGSSAGGQFVVGDTTVSTDSISFRIMNLTGAASSSFAQATASVTYLVVD